MIENKGVKVIKVNSDEHMELVKIIENMEGVVVKKTITGTKIQITRSNIHNNKHKRRKNIGFGQLNYICPKEKKYNVKMKTRQSSAIIAKSL